MNDRQASRASGKQQPSDRGASEQAALEALKSWWPVPLVLATIGAGYLLGHGVAVLVLAAGVLVAAIATFWNSIRALFGETPLTGEDAYALGAPSVEEEQKRAVLRAIKDLEFERTVGKISDQDYQTLIARYRMEAKRLLRVLDDQAAPRRAAAEKLADRYLAEHGLRERPRGEDTEENPFAEPLPGGDEPEVVACPGCGTSNDADAVFCKKCGKRLAVSEADADADEGAEATADSQEEADEDEAAS